VPEEQATERLVEILGQIKKLPSANLEPPQFFANYLQLGVAATGSRRGGGADGERRQAAGRTTGNWQYSRCYGSDY